MTIKKICFASDNYAGIHLDVLQAIERVNADPAIAYGDDVYTARAIADFQHHFGDDTFVFFVFNGTAANVTGLAAMLKSFEAIICTTCAHIQMDECGAPEKLTGSKLLLVPQVNGKLTVASVKQYLHRVGDQHHVQPRVISISQSTEYGTVYSKEEVRAIADFAHQNNMYLHMDGARISNAAVSLDDSLRAITKDLGVDVLSFGGTKNGLMLGEAVLIFNEKLAENFLFIRKQFMQLASKMRFIAAQFSALLTNDLWRENAKHANLMARKLEDRLRAIPNLKITQAVDANAIFAIMPKDVVERLQTTYYFYVWDEETTEVRLMTSFQTKEEEVDRFASDIAKLMS